MRTLALVCLTLSASIAIAAERLDDSLSPRQDIDILIDWRHRDNLENLDEEQLNALSSTVNNVEVRLNTAQYLGRQARIYLVLPVVIRGLDDPGALRLSWSTRGVFADGTVTPGMRALLYDGNITSQVMIDVLDFTIDIDGRAFNEPINFEPEYEIETVTP
jgi:hypothetical protein